MNGLRSLAMLHKSAFAPSYYALGLPARETATRSRPRAGCVVQGRGIETARRHVMLPDSGGSVILTLACQETVGHSRPQQATSISKCACRSLAHVISTA